MEKRKHAAWYLIFLSLLICFYGCFASQSKNLVTHTKWEYAAFYAEQAGDFIAPIAADSPRKYAWTDVNGMYIANDITDIWKHFGIDADQEYSHNYIEVVIINHLGSKGWELIHFDVDSVLSKKTNVQSIYRYIFRRPIKE